MNFPPVGPSIMWYFFEMINSWSRLPLFSPSIPPTILPTTDFFKLKWIEMKAERAQGNNIYVNDITSYIGNRHLLRLDVCDVLNTSTLTPTSLRFEWSISGVDDYILISTVAGFNCSQVVQVDKEATPASSPNFSKNKLGIVLALHPPNALFYGSSQLNRLGRYLKEEIRPKQVIMPWYFDMSKNEQGQLSTNCEDLSAITVENLKKAEILILRRLNRLITETGRKFGWKVMGDQVDELFSSRGMCSKNSLIR
uniref:Uncharacterized protein n=1 Tax=Ditylenchus dipsaci TaxID=166011 RepID=A0A915D2V5_9BILA